MGQFHREKEKHMEVSPAFVLSLYCLFISGHWIIPSLMNGYQIERSNSLEQCL